MTDSATLDSVRERIVDPLAERLAREYGSSSVERRPSFGLWRIEGRSTSGATFTIRVTDEGRFVVATCNRGSARPLLATLRAEGLL